MNGTHLTLGLVGLAALAGVGRRGSRASIDEAISDRYGHGECHAFTRALMERVPGGQIWVVALDDVFHDDEILHSMVKSGDRFLDAYGWGTVENKLDLFAFRKTRASRLYVRRARSDEAAPILKTKGILDARAAVGLVLEAVGHQGSRATRAPKRPTLATLGLPTLWFHGTRAAFTGRLRPNKGMGGACVWLADREGAKAYAGQGPTARVLAVTLDPSARVADLSDTSDPVVREFIRRDRSASNLRWHNREEVTDEEMREAVASWEGRATHYDAIEARAWAKDYFRRAGIDALLVRDVEGWGGRRAMKSLCVLNRGKIWSEAPA